MTAQINATKDGHLLAMHVSIETPSSRDRNSLYYLPSVLMGSLPRTFLKALSQKKGSYGLLESRLWVQMDPELYLGCLAICLGPTAHTMAWTTECSCTRQLCYPSWRGCKTNHWDRMWYVSCPWCSEGCMKFIWTSRSKIDACKVTNKGVSRPHHKQHLSKCGCTKTGVDRMEWLYVCVEFH